MLNDNNREIYREQFLRHYGVLGMKWGKRKANTPSSSSSKKTSAKSGNKRRMSNKELSAKLRRIKMEQEYERLTEAPKKKTVSSVEKIVKTAGTVASLTGAALTIYRNLNELGSLASKAKGAK